MTVLHVSHRTTYAYDSPVSFSQHLLRLAPRNMPGQQVLETAIAIDPKPDERLAFADFFGNAAEIATLERQHRELSITSTCRVRRAPPPDLMLEASVPWERAAAVAREPAGLAAAPYAHPGTFSQADDALEDYARESFRPGRPVFAAARELTTRIFEDHTYTPGATGADTKPIEAFAARHGVCQDFAHIMLAGMRALGLAARYVSGYLRTIPPEGQAALIGADASHAWVSVWDPALGWVDFDPTNDLIPGADHIALSFGRDFADVSPIAGLVVGSGAQRLSVGVTVTADD